MTRWINSLRNEFDWKYLVPIQVDSPQHPQWKGDVKAMTFSDCIYSWAILVYRVNVLVLELVIFGFVQFVVNVSCSSRMYHKLSNVSPRVDFIKGISVSSFFRLIPWVGKWRSTDRYSWFSYTAIIWYVCWVGTSIQHEYIFAIPIKLVARVQISVRIFEKKKS